MARRSLAGDRISSDAGLDGQVTSFKLQVSSYGFGNLKLATRNLELAKRWECQ